MGLDMYLEKDIWIGGYFEHKKARGTVEIEVIGFNNEEVKLNIPVNKISSIVLHMGYWRKANQIHGWFVDNVQNGVDECQRSWVEEEQLKKLKAICQKVLDNPERASELLPTQSGFFFGSTEYDEYYFKDLKDTIEIIDKCLENEMPGDYYYHSSW